MTRDSSFGGLVSHIKHHLKSGISKAILQPSCDPSIHPVLHLEFISKSDPFEGREKTIRRDIAPVMVVSGSMMLPVSQAPSICTGGASSSYHKKFENSLSTKEEDLVPAMDDEVDGEEDKSSSFCRLLVIKMKNKKCDCLESCLEAFRSHMFVCNSMSREPIRKGRLV
ncbi:hypothetical protein DY000_02054162 [Brassica cretica]|uniref:Uncharacterized protein n=1 Tax=Brassica cretica TaxID=69181 RepID=A0ABQ7AAT5_BRACR|nr:hypothetical protein DY000_02054162 [Brassica cretica]